MLIINVSQFKRRFNMITKNKILELNNNNLYEILNENYPDILNAMENENYEI